METGGWFVHILKKKILKCSGTRHQMDMRSMTWTAATHSK